LQAFSELLPWSILIEITFIRTRQAAISIEINPVDAAGNLVGDVIGFTSPSNIDSGHTATFDSLATSDQIGDNPELQTIL
jgi:hypothetical protein